MKISLLVSLAWGLALITLSPVLGAPQVSKQAVVGRWLEVKDPVGDVFIAPPRRRAKEKDRLLNIDDQITTDKDASTELWIGNYINKPDIGLLQVGEQAELHIKRIEQLSNGARRILLVVDRGTVKLRLRKLRNPKSNIQLFTPAGTAAVRGTIFGVSVNGKGISGVATEQGKVVVSNAGKTLLVTEGFARVLVPGKPPSKLRAIPETVRLFDIRYQHLGTGQVSLSANTDPGNLVQVASQPVDIDEQGNFQVLVSDPLDRLIPVRITTPLNVSKQFRLTILEHDLP